MVGVSLVGFSGSMIKDAVKDSSTFLWPTFSVDGTALAAPVPPPEPIEEPQVTKVLLGEWRSHSQVLKRQCAHCDMSSHVILLALSGVFFVLFAQVL